MLAMRVLWLVSVGLPVNKLCCAQLLFSLVTHTTFSSPECRHSTLAVENHKRIARDSFIGALPLGAEGDPIAIKAGLSAIG